MNTPSTLTDMKLQKRLYGVLHLCVLNTDGLIKEDGLDSAKGWLPQYMEAAKRVFESAKGVLDARVAGDGIKEKCLVLDTAITGLEKLVRNLHPEVRMLGHEILRDGYAARIVASSDDMINHADAEARTKVLFPPDMNPPGELFERYS